MKFNKKIMVGLVLSAMLAVTSSAAFEKTNTYTDGKFTDVPVTEWYAAEVKNTYELGLMNGTSDTTFNPNGNVSVAEAITMASRAASIYAGDTIPEAEGEWYQKYVKYATSKGFVKAGQFDSYDRSITRAEMSVLFYDAMPDGFFKRINNVNELPDVDKNADYYSKILNLYNAGIIMGNDAYGNFNPSSSIKRSESAAIINRVALETSRVRRALLVANPEEYPATNFFIDDINSASGHKTSLVSGWDYDNRSSFTDFADTQTATLSDIYSDGGLKLKRDINPLTEGKFTLHTSATVTSVNGGFYFQLTDDNGLDVVKLCGENGVFTVKCGEKIINTGIVIKPSIQFTVKGDLDTKRADLYFDGKVVASFDMPAETKEITKYIVGTTEEGKVSLSLKNVQLYSNFLVNDIFMATPAGVLPSEWISNDSTATVVAIGGSRGDANSLRINPKAGVNSYAKRYFDAAKGKIVLETYVHTPKAVSGVYVAAKSGDTEAFKIVTNGNNFETSKGTLLRKYTDNVWQCIRIEADIATQKAFVRINGKAVGEHAFDNAVTYLDNIEIGATAAEDTVLTFDDIVVYTHHDYDDYVPVPVPAVSEGYDIGVQVCSLWRNGYHSGWDTISNFPELEPYLGYYDEGNIEVADWEIKYMVEHGIDFQHFCWYCPSGDIQDPIKSPGMFEALHDGYFNAKYSDMMKFNIMWENGGTNVKSLDQFKEFIWPYWMEYYFTDDRYMTVDNKPVLTVWTYSNFINAFGSEAKAKEAVEFMNEDIKKIGRDGMIILFHDVHNQSKDVFETMKAAGADGTYSYNLNRPGYDPDYQINRHKTQRATGVFHNTASIGVGFNDVGWAGTRQPMITNEGFEKVARFMKDEYLKETEGDGTPWHSTLLFVSTWNEFGEGHFIAPTGHNGFGYLDVIRKVFTDNKSDTHNDIKPTEAQKARINQLYPKGRSIIDQLAIEEKAVSSYVTLGELEINEDNFKILFGHKDFKVENGVIKGSSTEKDYGFQAPGLSIDAESVKVLKVRAKISEKDTFQIFYTTELSTNWSGYNEARVSVEKTGEYVEYLFDFSNSAAWRGTVTGLRFDPTNCPASYEIDKVELLGFDMSDKVKLEINTEEIEDLPFDPVIKDGNAMVAIKLGTGVLSRMSLYHEYSRFDKTFYLASKKHELLMTEGTNKAVFDGKEITMPFTYTTRDGLPYIALNYIAELFECSASIENGKLVITTVGGQYLEELKNRVPYEYEFNIPGLSDGWSPASTSFEFTETGTITGTATDYADRPEFHDPAFHSPELNIPAVAYPAVEIRMKTNLPANTDQIAVIYFNVGSGLSESRTAKINISSVEKDAEGYGVYKFDLASNKEYTGTVSAIRFDPFNCAGSVEIDYIRFIRDENVEISKDDLAGASIIINGDAEQGDTFAFNNSGCDITIVEDPENKDNKCYQITNKTRGVQSWTYFKHPYTFEPGATYLVEFDVKLKGFNDDKPEVNGCWININFVYLDDKGEKNHFINAVQLSTAEGWAHVKKELTVLPTTTDRTFDEWTVYSNPINGIGVDYYMDNIEVTKIS